MAWKERVVSTRKQLHGWWPGKRECTAERMLINPYNGCGIGCFFCYARGFPGYFQDFHEKGIITVAEDFDKIVAEQLDSIDIASCGYLSPVTDPFQPLNRKYRLSEKIIQVFVERNIPIEFVTKARIPQEAISLMKQQPYCFGQISILTLNEELRKVLVPYGASTGTLLRNLERLSREGIYAVCRIDPIFPYLTDRKFHLEQLIERALDSGARHIVASALDIPLKLQDHFFQTLGSYFGTEIVQNYRALYTERIGPYLHAQIGYRKALFSTIREICDKKGISFALCMEYELVDGKAQGLNQKFMSSRNCEGIDIPVHRRKGKRFYPASDCAGDCLHCTDPKCGIPDLAMGRPGSKKDWKLSDYRRWSAQLKMGDLFYGSDSEEG
ncbi:MAG TPA: radical SAM protein [Firmicutes bacterium]|nr:radical SAM protein [Bacillota bacterium]